MPLIDKITARVNNWVVKHLSYVGKIQLINYVLRSLYVCDGAVFSLFLKLLFKKSTRDIEDSY